MESEKGHSDIKHYNALFIATASEHVQTVYTYPQ